MAGYPEDAEDTALEAMLQSLSLTGRPADPAFTARVLAALPPLAVPAPSRIRVLGAWASRRAAALLVLAGLLIMVATGDVAALLSGGWQAAGDWISAASAGAANTALASGTSPEGYFGLIVGATLLAAGAGLWVVRGLDGPEPRPGLQPARRAGLA